MSYCKSDQVTSIARRLGLSEQSVHTVLTEYTNLVVEDILNSPRTVPYLGIVELTSNPDGFIRGLEVQDTLAYQMGRLSRQVGYAQPEVEGIISAMYHDTIEALFRERHVNVYTLAIIKITDEGLRTWSSRAFLRHGTPVRVAVTPGFKQQFTDYVTRYGLN